MGVVVAFDPTAWKLIYSEFAYLTDPQATNYFNQAAMIHRNDGGGPVVIAKQQTDLLNMLTAHVAKLFAPSASGQPASPLVGRISQAAEGTVNVTAEYASQISQSMAWFVQTQYGAMYWQATAPFRTARYIPNDRNPVNAGTGIYGGYSGGSGWIG